MDPVDPATSPVLRVERYALYGEIGKGAMATVHLGHRLGAEGFSRAVAIKRLHPHLTRDPDLVAMLVDEARIASRIHHPNVVPILDVVTEQGEVFLVLEYVHGDSLSGVASRLRDERALMPPEIASAILANVLYGLSASHEACDARGEPLGLVHRDVSPQNVVVGVDGTARLLDFGVAKAAGRLQTTRDGALKGKIAYMAPELVQQLRVTPRADLYAAGVVLWECLTNRRLFRNDDDAATVAQVLVGLVDPPSKYRPDLSEAVDNLVLKAVDRDPERRFQSAREMVLALEQAIPPARPADVGAWVQEVAADAIARRADLRTRMERAPPPSTAKEGPHSGPLETSVPSPRRRKWMLGVLALGSAAILVGGHLLTDRGSDAVSAAAPSIAAAPTAGVELPPKAEGSVDSLEPPLETPVNTSRTPDPPQRRSRMPPHADHAPGSSKCAEPFTIDANGMKRYKRACLKE